MYQDKLKDITCFLLDVDGVLTNGNLLLMPNGDFVRSMNVKDGYAMQLAIKKGYKIGIISGGAAVGIVERLQKLGIQDIYTKVINKLEIFKEFIEIYNLSPDQILYMGDDLPDYEVMTKVAIATCPANAVAEIKSIAHYISTYNGGDGCVRDAIEQVLKVQEQWFDESIPLE